MCVHVCLHPLCGSSPVAPPAHDLTATSSQTIKQLSDKHKQVLPNHSNPALTSVWTAPRPIPAEQQETGAVHCHNTGPSEITSTGEHLNLCQSPQGAHGAPHPGGWSCFLLATRTGRHAPSILQRVSIRCAAFTPVRYKIMSIRRLRLQDSVTWLRLYS